MKAGPETALPSPFPFSASGNVDDAGNSHPPTDLSKHPRKAGAARAKNHGGTSLEDGDCKAVFPS
jgi:hypothetical protein